ncbi:MULTISPECIES: DNA-binding protein [unclassified Rhodococcus (in: high G+C Gram-positive bacteria)]|uniref:DNA-binding protein n=1 Tax=unclassified Rhodococcus (in: high G+C Gram-positive bacteria) TaxID=192944 RepID=UPI000B9B2541|nr:MULTISPECIES: DNA-binding protein [unclassified Rhodococcus (in: high G+C Gram-positive bacteria)]OZE34582.1 DNA-binding protein [Rhodococcus sp. 05-2254-4]OZE46223.1 DNA-binding protein [Rhodococcus sp. 05-2254-3]OZE50813.1 DNA-binding protein [Rhodococcus sp. 05-2254-2]
MSRAEADEHTDFPKGTGNPASGAFRAAGYMCLDDLAGVPAAELKKLHGVGPKALTVIQTALEQTGRSLG